MANQITKVPKLIKRARDAHKGNFGSILVVGGSLNMIGAPALCALAAFRSGAGLVTIAVPDIIQQSVATLVPCATTFGLQTDANGLVAKDCIAQLLNLIARHDVIVIGCGLGQSSALIALIETVILKIEKPIVIDADGLNALAKLGIVTRQLPDHCIITPHPGEFGRLFYSRFRKKSLLENRAQEAIQLANQCGGIVVLKGSGTIVTDGDALFTNKTGNPGMATGGTGDVLAGCIGALLAQPGLTPIEAAITAVYIHGKAGDIAVDEMGEISLNATDIIEALPEAFGAHTQ
jgi:NAD(P)H-hydrate epimerase